MRDEVTRHLGCSQIDAERIIDTMVARGFFAQQLALDGSQSWVILTS
jgi:hypothetical protein